MRTLGLVLTLTWVVGVATLVTACDPGEVIHFQNKTNEALFVEVNQTGLSRLSPGKNYGIGYLSEGRGGIGSGDNPLHIQLVDGRGCTVVNVETTVARFRKEHDFSLVINQADMPPPATRAPCDPVLADIATRTQE